MTGRRDAAIVLLAVAAAAAVEGAAGPALPDGLGDGAAGAALLAGGALALAVPRGRAGGALLLATGAAWFAGTWSGALVFVHRAPLVLLLLAYPRLWPRSRVGALLAAAGIASALVASWARSAGVTLALAVGLVAAAALRRRRSAGIERRAASAALGASAAVGAALAVAGIGRLGGGSVDDLALWCYEAAIVIAGAGLACDLRWGRWDRAAVSDLVADLGSLDAPDVLRARLARTLGDPALELAFGAAGVPERDGRAVSYVDDGGRRVAALVHDPSLLEDRPLLDAARAAARLVAANERMAAEVREGVERLGASRRRLVEAAIDQRRALEAELRAGAQRRLERVAERLRAIDGEAGVAAVVDSVERARDDLRRFAQGIHPATLTDHGLAAALTEAAALMPFPVGVDVPADRLPATVEVTVYFLCTEALANVGKHAGASRVDIAVRHAGGVVDATIDDDGRGGADLAAGTGLRGLADRIAALGGQLELDSVHGRGTRLHARIPI